MYAFSILIFVMDNLTIIYMVYSSGISKQNVCVIIGASCWVLIPDRTQKSLIVIPIRMTKPMTDMYSTFS